MINLGVFGVGHLGKIHVKCLQMLPEIYRVVGFYDPDDRAAAIAEREFGLTRFSTIDELLRRCEAVDIVTPTTQHFSVAAAAVSAGKHVFIEKPLTNTLEEGRQLLDLIEASSVKVQVGHVERFNPALLAVEDMKIEPMFIEAHRLATFNPRGTDVSVVLDLMIHDLDIILSLVRSEIADIRASGVSVVSETPDITNVRLEFVNGCVANLTASRISMKQMRKIRLFQRDAYLSLDFLDKKAQIIRLFDQPPVTERGNLLELETNTGRKYIHLDMPEIEPGNAIKMELETFAQSIREDRPTRVTADDGYKALQTAYRILDTIRDQATQLDVVKNPSQL